MNDHYGSTPVKSKINPYLYQEIQTASPEKLILILYDLGIKSCRTKNREKAAKVFIELIGALNFEYKEMALMFYDLYKYGLDQVHQNKFEDPLMILKELRDVWESAVMKKNQQNIRATNYGN